MITREQVAELLWMDKNMASSREQHEALLDAVMLADAWLRWRECDAEARQHCLHQLSSVRGPHNAPARNAALALLGGREEQP